MGKLAGRGHGHASFFTSTNAPLCSVRPSNWVDDQLHDLGHLGGGTLPGVYATFVDTDGNYNGSTSTNTVALETVNKATHRSA